MYAVLRSKRVIIDGKMQMEPVEFLKGGFWFRFTARRFATKKDFFDREVTEGPLNVSQYRYFVIEQAHAYREVTHIW